jgi:hypothetical protein
VSGVKNVKTSIGKDNPTSGSTVGSSAIADLIQIG